MNVHTFHTAVMRRLLTWASLGLALIGGSPPPVWAQAAPLPDHVRAITVADFEAVLARPSDTLVVYNFWATWCRPCVAELPHFQRLHDTYRDRGLQVVLVSLDFAENWPDDVLRTLQAKGIEAPVRFLTDGLRDNAWRDRLHPDWAGSIPATLLVRTPDLFAFREQDFTYEDLEAWVLPYLR